MEFWESAVLIVGGVWLVSYMAKQRQSQQASVIGTSIMGSAGTSNTSDLTTITNQAGGYPATYGEPLMPPQPPITPVVNRPIAPIAPNAPKIPVSIGVSGKPVQGVIAPVPIFRTPVYTPGNGRPVGIARMQLL